MTYLATSNLHRTEGITVSAMITAWGLCVMDGTMQWRIVHDAWSFMRHQTYGYLPSRRASPPIDRYQTILLGDRGTRVWTTCPRLLAESGTAGIRTCNLLCHEPTPRPLRHQATPWPLRHQATYMYNMHLLAITTEVESFIQRKYSSILQTQLWIINYKKSPCYVVIICGINWYFKHTLCYLWNLKSGYICNVAEGIILIAQLQCVKTAIKTQLNMQHRWTLELNANAACTGSTTHSIPPTWVWQKTK